jgi:hypothetical protein
MFVGGWALAQLWLFWVAPLIGGALGAVVYRWLSEEPAGVVEGKTRLTSLDDAPIEEEAPPQRQFLAPRSHSSWQ